MITTLQQLYDHVNRFHTTGRLGEKEGKLYIYGGGRVSIPDPYRPAGRTPIEVEDLARLELRTPGPQGDFAPLADYDEQDAAAQIERWEARHHFDLVLTNAARAAEDLHSGLDALHPDDRAAAVAQYGELKFDLAEPDKTNWPE